MRGVRGLGLGIRGTEKQGLLAIALAFAFSACSAPLITATSTPDASPLPNATTQNDVAAPTEISVPETPTPIQQPHPELIVGLPSLDGGPVPAGALMRLGIGSIRIMELSPDGRYAAVGTSVGLYLYEAETLKLIWKVAVSRPYGELAWSPDGAMIAGRNREASYLREPDRIVIWDASTGTVVTGFEHSTGIGGFAWSPDSSRIAIGWGGERYQVQGQITIWDVSTSQQQIKIQVPPSPENPSSPAFGIDALGWSPDGKMIAATAQHIIPESPVPTMHTTTVVIWDTTSTAVQHFIALDTGDVVQNLSFSPNSRRLALYTGYYGCDAPRGDSRAFVIDTVTGAVTHRPTEDTPINPSSPILSAAWSPDSSALATGSSDAQSPSSITFGDVSGPSPVNTIASGSAVNSLAWSPDGTQIAAAELLPGNQLNGRVSVWNAQTGELTIALYALGLRLDKVIWLPNGISILYQADRQLGIINSQTHQVVRQFSGLDSSWGIERIAWSPDGQQIAGLGSPRGAPDRENVGIWNILDGHAESFITSEQEFATLYPDWHLSDAPPPKPYEITMPNNAEIILTNIDTGQIIMSLPDDAGNNATISPDGRLLATGSGAQMSHCGSLFVGTDENEVSLWDIATQTRLKVWVGHTAPVTSVAFSPDSRLLASSSIDGTVIIWPVEP